jgi:hypothetical protein
MLSMILIGGKFAPEIRQRQSSRLCGRIAANVSAFAFSFDSARFVRKM